MITIDNPRLKKHFTIRHNGFTYDMGKNTLTPVMKKAHHMVRNYLMNQWRHTRCNVETKAVIMADGDRVGCIYGNHRNRNIQIIHL